MQKPHILIVDDEAQIRSTLQRWFEMCGFSVDIAEDGQDAVDKCRERDFDVVTMDLMMPRMNGVEAIAAIKARRPETPIIVLTGYSDDSEQALARGASRVLNKPLRLRELEREVRSVLEDPPPS